MYRLPFALLMVCTAANVVLAGEPEVFRVMPPGERVLESGVPGISAVVIVESGGNEQGGLLRSDLRGRFRLELGGVILEARDGHGFSVDSESGEESALDASVTRRLLLHDFPALALETRPVFDELTQLDEEGTRWEGRSAGGESGILYRDERGRISGYDVQFDSGEPFEVRFLNWVRLGDLEMPSRARTSDATGDHLYRIGGYREEAMPETGTDEPARWRDESELPGEARCACG